MNPAPNLALVGPMGAGKSAVGRLLAERLGLRFADLDHEIEAQAGAGLATWTVAAAVRRGLDEAGFDLVRRPGLPPKRHCLAGRWRPGD